VFRVSGEWRGREGGGHFRETGEVVEEFSKTKNICADCCVRAVATCACAGKHAC